MFPGNGSPKLSLTFRGITVTAVIRMEREVGAHKIQLPAFSQLQIPRQLRRRLRSTAIGIPQRIHPIDTLIPFTLVPLQTSRKQGGKD